MTAVSNPAHAWSVLVAIAFALGGCSHSETLAEQCGSSYPKPTDAQIAADTMSIPTLESISVYRPSDSLPQIFSADSSIGQFRNLFHARFGAFRSEQEVRSFISRFQARIVGKAETDDWYAVMIPDPGPDTSKFNLLKHCIGANYGVYVRSVYSRLLFQGDTAKSVLPR
jgi:hypothetical protein